MKQSMAYKIVEKHDELKLDLYFSETPEKTCNVAVV